MSIMPTNQDICPETIRSPAAIFIKVPLFETEHRLPAIGQSPTKYREHLPASLDELFVRARGVPRRRVPA